MAGKSGSLRAISKELIRLYGLRLAVWVPIFVAIVFGVVSGLHAPADLAANAKHAEWTDLFSASGGIIAALLVALAVEAHTPFTRSGALAVRLAASSAGLMLGVGGLAAVVGLSPSLSNGLYPILLGLTIGGVAGGLTAVVMLGIGVAIGTMRRIDQDALKKLQELGQPFDAEELFRARGI